MKIYFFLPFKTKLTSSCTESYEFYITLKNLDNIKLINNFEDADYILYMMDLRNCDNMPWYDKKI